MSAPVAIICGGGGFPLAVAEAARRAGREVFLVGLHGAADPDIAVYPHMWLKLGEFGKLFRSLAERSVKELSIVGSLTRPDFSDLRLDFGGVRRLPDIARILRGGDDHALRGVVRFFEDEGYTVVGAHDLAPSLLLGEGPITTREPDAAAREDIALGVALGDALSAFDTGQSVVVANRRVVAVEAAEGTDAMVERVAQLRATGKLRLKGRCGVLVKAPKRGQDLRVDLPAIGPRTIAAAAAAQLDGIALAAHGVLVLQRDDIAAEADRLGLFVAGVTRPAAGA